MIVIATDGPLLPHQLNRLARRAALGLGRTGSIAADTSGDIFLAFSTARVSETKSADGFFHVRMIDNHQLSVFFEACVQAVEEAIINALVAAETMVGRDGRRVVALPHDRTRKILSDHHRLSET